MATTVNLLPSSWTKTSSGGWSANNCSGSAIGFDCGQDYQGQGIYAKAVIAIDISLYSSITFSWTGYSAGGITDLCFGVFNSTTATDATGTGVTTLNTSASSVTINTASLTGTKYIGFYCYSNGWNSDNYRYAQCTISALTGIRSSNTITYKPGNYSSGSTYTATKEAGASLTLRGSTYSRTGYTQAGWSTAAAGTSKTYALSASYSTDADITLYPYWTANNYTVTFNSNGGTSGSTTSKSYTYGTAVTSANSAIVCSKTDYSFKGFYTATSGGTQVFDSSGKPVTGNSYWNSSSQWIYAGAVTLYARYELVTAYFTTSGDEGFPDEVSKYWGKVQYGGSFRMSATLKDDYFFNYWTLPNGVQVPTDGVYDNRITASYVSPTYYLQVDSASSIDSGTYYLTSHKGYNFTASKGNSAITSIEGNGLHDIGKNVIITFTVANSCEFDKIIFSDNSVLTLDNGTDTRYVEQDKNDESIYYLHLKNVSLSDPTSCSIYGIASTYIRVKHDSGVSNITGETDSYVAGSTTTITANLKIGYQLYQLVLPDRTVLKAGQSSGNVSLTLQGLLLTITITNTTSSNAGYYTIKTYKSTTQKQFKARMYLNGKWRKAKPYVRYGLVIPTNAVVDVNDIPILTSDRQLILVDENTTGLTAEYTYYDWECRSAYIAVPLGADEEEEEQAIVYSSAYTPVYIGPNQYVYIKND